MVWEKFRRVMGFINRIYSAMQYYNKRNKKVSSEYLEYVQRICNVFLEAEDEYKEIKIISIE